MHDPTAIAVQVMQQRCHVQCAALVADSPVPTLVRQPIPCTNMLDCDDCTANGSNGTLRADFERGGNSLPQAEPRHKVRGTDLLTMRRSDLTSKDASALNRAVMNVTKHDNGSTGGSFDNGSMRGCIANDAGCSNNVVCASGHMTKQCGDGAAAVSESITPGTTPHTDCDGVVLSESLTLGSTLPAVCEGAGSYPISDRTHVAMTEGCAEEVVSFDDDGGGQWDDVVTPASAHCCRLQNDM